jgi:hypothetical protein
MGPSEKTSLLTLCHLSELAECGGGVELQKVGFFRAQFFAKFFNC